MENYIFYAVLTDVLRNSCPEIFTNLQESNCYGILLVKLEKTCKLEKESIAGGFLQISLNLKTPLGNYL